MHNSQSENENMKQELKKYADNDPALLDAMSKRYKSTNIGFIFNTILK